MPPHTCHPYLGPHPDPPVWNNPKNRTDRLLPNPDISSATDMVTGKTCVVVRKMQKLCERLHTWWLAALSSVSRVNILGVGITPVSLAQTIAMLESWPEEGPREYLCCVSVHGLVEARRDRDVRCALSRAALSVEDVW
jgi:hypothetical protein